MTISLLILCSVRQYSHTFSFFKTSLDILSFNYLNIFEMPPLKLYLCRRLTHGSQRYPALIPKSWKCYFIWDKKDLTNAVKDAEMGEVAPLHSPGGP